MNVVDAYARSVVAGDVPAGKYHRAPCARHLRDRAREGTPEFPYVFDIDRAERFFRFAEKLKHYKGEWAGQFIALQPYQKFRLGSIFGWVHMTTGLRRFRNSYNEIPRKNGKSLEAAVVALYVTFFDGEPGAEGYCAATKRDQAKLVFNDAKKLVQSSGLKARINVLAANLHRDDTASKLEPLGADHDSTDGLNPNLVNIDELHAHKTRGLIDVLETATGARRQPLVFKITTAGDDPVSPCGDEHDYACKVLDGILVDERYFAFIAHADTAYTAAYHSLHALEQMVSLCSCSLIKAVDHDSETQNAIPIAPTSVGECASPATAHGSGQATPNTLNASAIASSDGRSETWSGTAPIKSDGTQITKDVAAHRIERPYSRINTESLQRNTTASIDYSAGNAESAVDPSTCSQLTTATIRARFADCFAGRAIPASVFSEILSAAYDEHSPTCAVRHLAELRNGALIVAVPADDWKSPATAAKANPNYGVSVNPEDLAGKVTKATSMPSAAATYKQKHLNLWVNATAPCLSVDGWRKGQSDWTEADLEGEECFVGVDLASKIDLCAVSFVFPPAPGRPTWRMIQRLFTPADTLVDRAHRDRAPYGVWVDQGWLIAVPGTSIDHDLVRQAILRERGRFDILKIGFDPWHADTPIKNLVSQDGFSEEHVLEVPQTYAGMSAACLKVQADILAGEFDARRCPVTAWAVSNVVGQRDGKDNLMFAKGKSRGRIDPVIAATIGVALTMRHEPIKPSVYESRGVLVL